MKINELLEKLSLPSNLAQEFFLNVIESAENGADISSFLNDKIKPFFENSTDDYVSFYESVVGGCSDKTIINETITVNSNKQTKERTMDVIEKSSDFLAGQEHFLKNEVDIDKMLVSEDYRKGVEQAKIEENTQEKKIEKRFSAVDEKIDTINGVLTKILEAVSAEKSVDEDVITDEEVKSLAYKAVIEGIDSSEAVSDKKDLYESEMKNAEVILEDMKDSLIANAEIAGLSTYVKVQMKRVAESGDEKHVKKMFVQLNKKANEFEDFSDVVESIQDYCNLYLEEAIEVVDVSEEKPEQEENVEENDTSDENSTLTEDNDGNSVEEYAKLVEETTDGMIETDKIKFTDLIEGLEFEGLEDYKGQILKLKESFEEAVEEEDGSESEEISELRKKYNKRYSV